MSAFNTRGARPRSGTGPITSEATPSGRTFEGAPGYVRDEKSELFLLAVSTLAGQDKFYESGAQSHARFVELVRAVAPADPVWFTAFVTWLRGEGNVRTGALVAALEGAAALNEAKIPGHTRRLVAAALQRADEPGEAVAYWRANHSRSLPGGVQRGIADAVARLYTERSLLKYDSEAHAYRFGDVLNLVHATPRFDLESLPGAKLEDMSPADERAYRDTALARQSDLFAYAVARRYRDVEVPSSLRTLTKRAALGQLPVEDRRKMLPHLAASGELGYAGVTWESLAGWLQGPMDRQAWEAIIPQMGYMALLRNLRNFDQAGVSDEVAQRIADKLCDPEEVARSRQFPFRFWAAYKNVQSLRWGQTLETALRHSLSNVPALDGRPLILVDRSPSMFPGFHFSTSNKSDITLADQAALFGAALALRAKNPTLVEFGGQSRPITVPRGGSVLRLVEAFGRIDGTDIPSAVKAHLAGHDRIIIVTDEQTRAGYLPSNMHYYGGARETAIDDLVPKTVPLYMWNMAGYRHGATPVGGSNRHALGGLTDASFRLIPLLEAGRSGRWPWQA